MAITQADIDRLEKALTTGTLSVEIEGQRITYRSIADLKLALDYARAALPAAANERPTTVYARFQRD